MGSEAEPAKLLLPYLQRADELQKHDLLVAYYCRLYAMEKGLKIPPKERTKTTNSILVSLMNQLEKDKKSIKLGPEDNLHVEGFASNIFAKADKQDRAGRADLNTAKTFYAAFIFFDILNQFGELQPDIEQKQKYAVWKAADIRKALKEGRKPEPGPPGGDEDLAIPSNKATNTSDLGPSESFSTGLSSVDTSSPHIDNLNIRSPSSSYNGAGYSGDVREPPPPKSPENSTYPQSYHQQSYSREQSMPPNYHPHDHQDYHSNEAPSNYPSHDATPQNYPSHESSPQNYPSHETPPQNYPSQETPQNYPSQETPQNYPSQETPQNYPSHESSVPPYTYPNFQSYPSFNDSTLPTAPGHYPSHYQGSDTVYSHQSASASNNTPAAPYTSGSGIGTNTVQTPPPSASYTYDSNYQPSVENIAEAHKAARFAVGALAFDDVPVAVDFLKRSLELLTNPSAKSN